MGGEVAVDVACVRCELKSKSHPAKVSPAVTQLHPAAKTLFKGGYLAAACCKHEMRGEFASESRKTCVTKIHAARLSLDEDSWPEEPPSADMDMFRKAIRRRPAHMGFPERSAVARPRLVAMEACTRRPKWPPGARMNVSV